MDKITVIFVHLAHMQQLQVWRYVPSAIMELSKKLRGWAHVMIVKRVLSVQLKVKITVIHAISESTSHLLAVHLVLSAVSAIVKTNKDK